MKKKTFSDLKGGDFYIKYVIKKLLKKKYVVHINIHRNDLYYFNV